MATNQDPTSVEKALTCSEKEKRKIAMDKKYNALMKTQVWDFTVLPEGKKTLKSKCVFKAKRNDTVNHKARLVVKGCSQKIW